MLLPSKSKQPIRYYATAIGKWSKSRGTRVSASKKGPRHNSTLILTLPANNLLFCGNKSYYWLFLVISCYTYSRLNCSLVQRPTWRKPRRAFTISEHKLQSITHELRQTFHRTRMTHFNYVVVRSFPGTGLATILCVCMAVCWDFCIVLYFVWDVRVNCVNSRFLKTNLKGFRSIYLSIILLS